MLWLSGSSRSFGSGSRLFTSLMLWRAAVAACQALTNIEGIIAKSQALMVARGDLGVELGLNRVPFAQKLLIARAKQAGLFVALQQQVFVIHSH